MPVSPKEIVTIARSFLGVPWVHQGRDPNSGLDCLGLLIVVGKRINYLPEDFEYIAYHRAPDGQTLLRELRSHLDEIMIEELTEGDVVVIRLPMDVYPRHVGIVANGLYETSIIHALRDKTLGRVIEEPFRKWTRYVTHGFRFREIE